MFLLHLQFKIITFPFCNMLISLYSQMFPPSPPPMKSLHLLLCLKIIIHWPDSFAAGKNRLVTRIITWGQNAKFYPISSASSVRLSVCLSLTDPTIPSPMNQSGWNFYGTLRRGPCMHISETGQIGWNTTKLWAKTSDSKAKNSGLLGDGVAMCDSTFSEIR